MSMPSCEEVLEEYLVKKGLRAPVGGAIAVKLMVDLLRNLIPSKSLLVFEVSSILTVLNLVSRQQWRCQPGK